MHFSRRQFVQLMGLAAAGFAAPGLVHAAADTAGDAHTPSADDVLQRLLDGNRRFVKGELAHPGRKPEDFAPLTAGQRPVAAIVGCSDSRVPPEILFDQGIGDLFVVRVAGNVVEGAGPSVKGSIEYAVAELGVPLIVVLGHSQCGAVKAALAHIEAHDALPGAIKDLVAADQTCRGARQRHGGKPVDECNHRKRSHGRATLADAATPPGTPDQAGETQGRRGTL